MPRSARKKASSGIYHVMLRGADRRIIFADDEDCRVFLDILRHTRKRAGFSLYAYCLMGNHVHLLVREGKDPLERIIKRLGVTYVSYYNQKYDLLGHLFQDRFRSEPVESTAYFLDVLRYICQNPVKAGLCGSPAEYRWLGCYGLKVNQDLDSLEEYTPMKGQELLEFLLGPCEEEHLEDLGGRRLTDREAIARLCRACGSDTVQEIGGWEPERMKAAVLAGRDAGISIRQMARLTGISKAVIERICGVPDKRAAMMAGGGAGAATGANKLSEQDKRTVPLSGGMAGGSGAGAGIGSGAGANKLSEQDKRTVPLSGSLSGQPQDGGEIS